MHANVNRIRMDPNVNNVLVQKYGMEKVVFVLVLTFCITINVRSVLMDTNFNKIDVSNATVVLFLLFTYKI